MNPYIGDDAIDHMDSIMKNIFTPDELAEINSDIDNEIHMIEADQEAGQIIMSNSPIGESWSSYRKRAFTPEELATSKHKVEMMKSSHLPIKPA